MKTFYNYAINLINPGFTPLAFLHNSLTISNPLFSLNSTRYLSSTSKLGYYPPDPYDPPSDHYDEWLVDDIELKSDDALWGESCQAYNHFLYFHITVGGPGMRILFSLSLRLDDDSIIEILPLLNVGNIDDDEVIHTLIKGLLIEKSNELHNSEGNLKVTDILTKGRIESHYDKDDIYSTTPYAEELFGEFYDDESDEFDLAGFIK